MVRGSEGANEKEDSQEDFSLNLCLATASTGGRHEVIRPRRTTGSRWRARPSPSSLQLGKKGEGQLAEPPRQLDVAGGGTDVKRVDKTVDERQKQPRSQVLQCADVGDQLLLVLATHPVRIIVFAQVPIHAVVTVLR